MPIITISRGSYSKGKEIAEKLADKLGYKCISRDLLLETSKDFHVPEIKLVRALHDAPSILDRFTYGKERYVAFIHEALLESVKEGKVIYHGLAGHFLLKDIPHIMKVRIIANFEDRVKEEMKRENIDEDKARYILKKDDDERRKWSLALYGIDTSDASLYDMVLHIETLTVDDVVEIIARAVKLPHFQTTPESQSILNDMLVAARIEVALIKEYPTVKVRCSKNDCIVTVRAAPSQQDKISTRVKEIVGEIKGVKGIKIVIDPIITAD